MNEQNRHLDSQEPMRDGEAATPTNRPGSNQEEPSESHDESSYSVAPEMEHAETGDAASPPTAHMTPDTPPGNEKPGTEGPADDAGTEEPSPTTAEEQSATESDDNPASAPSAEAADSQAGDGAVDGAEQARDTEPQPRRVLLQAGTDEESLKALALCREKVTQLHLRMHPLAARWESDRHVIIFFRADDKVDFRKLVRELSHLLHARIELRQVGPREQGKLCGLMGKCGYSLCCQTFLGQFAQSTIKMAKTQELALNPMKISGVCGRLLCCLNYEQDMYLEAKSRMPRVNKIVQTEFGQGRVVAVNVLKETVTVQLETMTRELRPDQVTLVEGQG